MVTFASWTESHSYCEHSLATRQLLIRRYISHKIRELKGGKTKCVSSRRREREFSGCCCFFFFFFFPFSFSFPTPSSSLPSLYFFSSSSSSFLCLLPQLCALTLVSRAFSYYSPSIPKSCVRAPGIFFTRYIRQANNPHALGTHEPWVERIKTERKRGNKKLRAARRRVHNGCQARFIRPRGYL